MSFFGGFGSSNTNNSSANTSAFGAFGSNNNNTTAGFGAANNNNNKTTGFGTAGNTGGGLFGTNTTSTFGSGGTGFGAANTNTSSPFGAPKPFGATNTTSSGSLFGSNTATAGTSSGFGGFGANNSNTGISTTFGGGNSLAPGPFGTNPKPAFGSGAGTTTGSSLFGTGGVSNFGTNNASTTTNGFGAGAGTALGAGNYQTDGTHSTPFQAFTEKEANGTVTNHYQNISFIPPYQKFSTEELRIADYIHGRRYGNQGGAAGAFGTNSNFGGFGANNPASGFGTGTASPFAAGNNATGFGAAQPAAAGAFGAGGLFGASKPASPFGTNATTSQPTGLFGGTATAGFGAASSSPFGNNNAPKPAAGGFGGFASGNSGATAPGAFVTTFGASNAGVFGGTPATASAFGQQPAAPVSAFGTGFGQPAQPSSGFNSGFAQGFPSKPAAFPNANPSTTGLFANNGPQLGTAGAFGAPAQSNSLFAAKPAIPGPSGGNSLFSALGGGNNAPAQAPFAGFGTPSQPQTQLGNGTNSLFGPPKPSLFATPTNNSLGGGLFNTTGSINNQASNFGTQSQQPSLGSLGMLGGPNTQQQQAQQMPVLSASISGDPSLAFGSQSLFSGLNLPLNAQSLGPIATPLSNRENISKSAIIPAYRLNPGASSRIITPQRQAGYGFSYSTYGSPLGASSVSSSPLGYSTRLGSSFGRNLGKSLSTSNLRHSFDSDDSVFAPNAFSASSNRFNGHGSLKKLVIDRNLRSDLFVPPEVSGALMSPRSAESAVHRSMSIPSKKRVSFNMANSGTNGAREEAREEDEHSGSSGTPPDVSAPSAEEQGFIRSSARTTGNSASQISQDEAAKGNELAIVHEDGTPNNVSKASSAASNGETSPYIEDLKPGAYWMKPSREELASMSKAELKKVENFTVGREGCGFVVFNRPVDLSAIDLDTIMGVKVIIITRSCTVYPNDGAKPPVGKGLNVPSTISLQNSWPRTANRSVALSAATKMKKHIQRLERVVGTHFKGYDKETGTWTFSVDHFTTYKLYDDDESDGEEAEFEEKDKENEFAVSSMSQLPDTPTPKSRVHREPSAEYSGKSSRSIQDISMGMDSTLDDTFEFKKRSHLPGAFDQSYMDEVMGDNEKSASPPVEEQSFLGERSVGLPSEVDVDEPTEAMDQDEEGGSVMDEDEEMAGSYPDFDQTTGLERQALNALSLSVASTPGRPFNGKLSQTGFIATRQPRLTVTGDWAQQLQRTISPKKQDRNVLRELQGDYLNERDDRIERVSLAKSKGYAKKGLGISTSIDLMNSLFGQSEGKKSVTGNMDVNVKGFGTEWPFQKSTPIEVDESAMSPMDKAYHNARIIRWRPDGTLYCSKNTKSNGFSRLEPLESPANKVVLVDVYAKTQISKETLQIQKEYTSIQLMQGVPFASIRADISFQSLVQAITSTDKHAMQEKLVWGLCNVLYGDIESKYPEDCPHSIDLYMEDRIRKEDLSIFWAELVADEVAKQTQNPEISNEEKAIFYLAGHDVLGACDALIKGGNYRLATLVSSIGASTDMAEGVTSQLRYWHETNFISEISIPIRALYEMCARNVTYCSGTRAAPTEDKAPEFWISEKFGLTWKQAFGMQLWYVIPEECSAKRAVFKYLIAINDAKEVMHPAPWYIEEDKLAPWKQMCGEPDGEDLLMGILRFYAHDEPNFWRLPGSFPEQVLTPINYTSDPLDVRLGWQLYQTLYINRVTEFPEETEADPYHKPDQLTWDLAAQLTHAGEWYLALWVLLHLSDNTRRSYAIQDHLARFARHIGEPKDTYFRGIVDELRIPEKWIWEAKALYNKSLPEHRVDEVVCLLHAHDWKEAHETLCKSVAPLAIIAQDHEKLKDILLLFSQTELIPHWPLGGQMYLDFLHLIELTEGAFRTIPTPAYQMKSKGLPLDNKVPDLLRRLSSGLSGMLDPRHSPTFIETVAVQEMSSVVAAKLLEQQQQQLDHSKILQLPMTPDASMRHTTDMGLQYYRAVLAAS
ncbi:MAG: hypothetical protein M1829_004165 [Trizodia sp. TS-e1964]|nr:MAG: hypothetical protein M1829_004165 [Trizodia sp. TS-e1964]